MGIMKEHHKKVLAPFMYERANYYYNTNVKEVTFKMLQSKQMLPPSSDVAPHPLQWTNDNWNWFLCGGGVDNQKTILHGTKWDN